MKKVYEICSSLVTLYILSLSHYILNYLIPSSKYLLCYLYANSWNF
jgi:hypothetical protein